MAQSSPPGSGQHGQASPWHGSEPSPYPRSPYPSSPYPAAWPPQQPYPVQPNMRAATADRERAVDVLKAAFAEGRLTQDEYNERMSRAYEARTYADLAALTGDLPAGPLPVPSQPHWAPVPSSRTNSMAIASFILGFTPFSLLAIICGHVANREISRTGERGSGLAAAGLALGYIGAGFWSLFWILTMTYGIRHGIHPDQGPFSGGGG